LGTSLIIWLFSLGISKTFS